jgi:GNAT superfamily N-acetyltransferase
MRFERITSIDSENFDMCWKIYETSFPADGRRSMGLQAKAFEDSRYSFFAVYDTRHLGGINAILQLSGDLTFIEHLAVKEDLRGRGIGTKMLGEFLRGNLGRVVLEVRRPDQKNAGRRIDFYERLGFHLNLSDYVQPSYGPDKDPVPMFLMSRPEELDEAGFEDIRMRIHTVAYGLERPLLEPGV